MNTSREKIETLLFMYEEWMELDGNPDPQLSDAISREDFLDRVDSLLNQAVEEAVDKAVAMALAAERSGDRMNQLKGGQKDA